MKLAVWKYLPVHKTDRAPDCAMGPYTSIIMRMSFQQIKPWEQSTWLFLSQYCMSILAILLNLSSIKSWSRCVEFIIWTLAQRRPKDDTQHFAVSPIVARWLHMASEVSVNNFLCNGLLSNGSIQLNTQNINKVVFGISILKTKRPLDLPGEREVIIWLIDNSSDLIRRLPRCQSAGMIS